jgi:hypothetical protein
MHPAFPNDLIHFTFELPAPDRETLLDRYEWIEKVASVGGVKGRKDLNTSGSVNKNRKEEVKRVVGTDRSNILVPDHHV